VTILDTDIFTLLTKPHPHVAERRRQCEDTVALTLVTRIEVLGGRFAFILKAPDGNQLRIAQQRLEQSEQNLSRFLLLPLDAAAAAEFDRLLQNKKLKKIGRPDLLIAAIALARRATVVTRNVQDFRQVPGLRVENWAD
jgi:tRNA(fMet)-specific endonuclease VapC